MKVRIKSYNGELPYYLTLGKEYEVIEEETENDCGMILDDFGYETTLIMECSAHLNGGSWEVVDNENH